MEMTRVTRGRNQRGNTTLEGALVLLPLMALGFAMLDFPLSIFIQNTLRSAVREGVRFAITQQTGPSGQDAAIKSVVESNSMGFLNDADISAGNSTFSITYYKVDPATGSLTTSGATNDAGNVIVISAAIKTKFMAPLWRSSGLLSFSATSSDMMEAPPNNTPVAR